MRDWSGEKPARKKGYTITQEGNQYNLLDLNLRIKTRFNQSVYTIWQLCDGELTVNEMVKLIKNAYPSQQGEIEGDIIRSLIFLEDAGVISI